MDIVTLALAKKGAKSYTDTKLGAITGDFNYLGSVATIEDLPSSANTGDEYTVGNQGPYVYNGTEWVAASIPGPQGEVGPEGPQGKPGKDGRDGGEINAYKEIKKIKDYLYETYYDECDYEYAKKYFEERKVNLNGACSAIRKGNFYGRNFDWVYDEGAEFIVRTPRIGNRFASMGVVGHVDELTNEFVESGEFSKEYKILPFKIVDGINEYGVVANSNVVPNDKGINPEAFPAIVERDRVCNLALVRYILDNFKTAQEAVEYIRDYVTIYPVKTLEDMNYELHFMIADEKKTYVLEIVDNVVRVIDVTEKPMMTNFYLYGVTFNEDGKTYYPAINDATHNAKITNGVTDHGCGLERYAKMVDAYSGLNDLSSMMEFMNHDLRYTKAYTGGDVDGIGEWYTEFVDGNLTVESGAEDFEAAISASKYAYQHRTRNPEEEYFGTWQSTHSVVYDIKNREMNIVVQEDNDRLKYDYNNLITVGGVQSDWNENDSSAADYVKNRTHWTEEQTEELINETLYYEEYSGHSEYYTDALEEPLNIKVGETVVLKVNDITYTDIAKSYGPYTYIGNLALGEFGPDTGEDYCLATWGYVYLDTYGLCIDINNLESDTEYETIVIQNVELVNKIAQKYIETDWNNNDTEDAGYIKNRTHWIQEMEEVKIINSEEADYNYEDVTDNDIAYTEYGYYNDTESYLFNFLKNAYDSGKIINLNFNDQTYQLRPNEIEDGYAYSLGDDEETFFSDEDNALGFRLSVNEDNTYYFIKYNSITGNEMSFEVIQTIYHPLDEVFIPDTFATKDYVDGTIAGAIGDINEVLSHLVTIPEEEQAAEDLSNLVDLPEEDE